MIRVMLLKSLTCVLVAVLSAGTASAQPQAGHADDAGPAMKVMSFNIRYPNNDDGENRWANRTDFVADTIRAYGPDLLGMQEVFPVQAAFLKDALGNDYEFLDVPRDGEFRKGGIGDPILFKKDRFERLDDGTFWLSETPDVAGSRGWDAAMPRLVRWAKLRDRHAGGENAEPLYFFNAHFDHEGPTAKLESAKLLRAKIVKIAGGAPVVVTGDFNSMEETPAYAALVGSTAAPALIDSYRAVHPPATPVRSADEATFHGFRGTNKNPNRIDWVLHSPHFATESAEIDRTSRDGRYPSDHFPVTATLRPAE